MTKTSIEKQPKSQTQKSSLEIFPEGETEPTPGNTPAETKGNPSTEPAPEQSGTETQPDKDKLSETERKRFDVHEKLLRTHGDGTVAAALAVYDIWKEKLYREDYSTFEEFLEDVPGWSRAKGYRYVHLAEVVKTLSQIRDSVIPIREAQVEPLAGYDVDVQIKAWGIAVKQAGKGEITRAIVEAAVAKALGKKVRKQKTAGKKRSELVTHLTKLLGVIREKVSGGAPPAEVEELLAEMEAQLVKLGKLK